ncbi:lytic transglycosylase domain-containing protein [Herbidospora daliensis]|uniref:aggregation-promoting factor C-terminal-like domain-containing protein n=1 Tax=Herbidospora daliensis TaxID=295585 RepID=UPI003F714BF6
MDSISARRGTVAAMLAFAALAGATPASACKGEHDGHSWKRRAAPSIKVSSKIYAHRLILRRDWARREFRCLDSLWTRESNWNHKARNQWSGAYGIPQAYPGDKMARAGWDWRVNPRTQIRWGIGYIKGRYGSPCGAWGHFRAHNWY